jgi:hypothetical protein
MQPIQPIACGSRTPAFPSSLWDRSRCRFKKEKKIANMRVGPYKIMCTDLEFGISSFHNFVTQTCRSPLDLDLKSHSKLSSLSYISLWFPETTSDGVDFNFLYRISYTLTLPNRDMESRLLVSFSKGSTCPWHQYDQIRDSCYTYLTTCRNN